MCFGIWFGITNKDTAYKEYDTDGWMELFKKVGFKYAILSMKDNNGWCRWDSEYTDYDIAMSKNNPNLARQFIEACRKHGIAVGFKYTLSWDDYHQQRMSEEEYYEFANHQLRELLTKFGPIDILWIEAGRPPDRTREACNTIKSIQPDCLVTAHGGNYNPANLDNAADIYQPSDFVSPPEGHSSWRKYRGKQYYIPWEAFVIWRFKGDSPPPKVLAALCHEIMKRGACALILELAEGGFMAEEPKRNLLRMSEFLRQLQDADRHRAARTDAMRKGKFVEASCPFVNAYSKYQKEKGIIWRRNETQRKIATEYCLWERGYKGLNRTSNTFLVSPLSTTEW
ncbi:MAG: alpha-L-fucosidase [Candidatus Poribacteria bacterium]